MEILVKVGKIAGCAVLGFFSLSLWAQTPAGWQVLKSPKAPQLEGHTTPGGLCTIVVPGNWALSKSARGKYGVFDSPSGKISAGVTELPNETLAEAKSGLVAPFGTTTMQSSAHSFWWSEADPDLDWSALVSSGPDTCGATVFFRDTHPDAATQALGKKILQSLKRAK